MLLNDVAEERVTAAARELRDVEEVHAVAGNVAEVDDHTASGSPQGQVRHDHGVITPGSHSLVVQVPDILDRPMVADPD